MGSKPQGKARTDQRRAAYRRGHRAELIACWYLRAKGFRIVARRFKTPVGEVDIIARRGLFVAFVEVKARADSTKALDAVSWEAQRRIESAAETWLGQQEDYGSLSWRFDVIAVLPWPLLPSRWPRHFKDVW